MSEYSKSEQYVDHIKSHILPFIDYSELQRSYETDMDYAKGILNRLHIAMGLIYGGETLTEEVGDRGFAVVPGVVLGKDSNNIGIALLTLDLLSSGEHCGTDFLCKYGVISQSGNSALSNIDSVLQSEVKEIRAAYLPYDYCYTAKIPGDIHVDMARLPEAIKYVLDDFHNHHTELLFEEGAVLPDPTGRGYLFVVTDDSDYIVPNALHIQRDDSMAKYPDDESAADAAEADGVRLIYGMPEIPDGIYLDTPENRAVIENHFDTRNALLTQIAKKHCRFETLETRRSDSLDFREVSVWGLKEALSEAYNAGIAHQLARSSMSEHSSEKSASAAREHTADAGDKTSVMAQIRQHAQEQRNRPPSAKSTPGHGKSDPEH